MFYLITRFIHILAYFHLCRILFLDIFGFFWIWFCNANNKGIKLDIQESALTNFKSLTKKLLPSVSPMHHNQFSPSTYSCVVLLADFRRTYLKPRYRSQGTYVITLNTIISTYYNNTQSTFQIDEISYLDHMTT